MMGCYRSRSVSRGEGTCGYVDAEFTTKLSGAVLCNQWYYSRLECIAGDFFDVLIVEVVVVAQVQSKAPMWNKRPVSEARRRAPSVRSVGDNGIEGLQLHDHFGFRAELQHKRLRGASRDRSFMLLQRRVARMLCSSQLRACCRLHLCGGRQPMLCRYSRNSRC